MPMKKAKTSHASTFGAGKRKNRASCPSNEHGIEFKDDDERERYEKLLNKRIVPTSSVQFVDEIENVEEPEYTVYFRMLNTDQVLFLYHLCEVFGLVNYGDTCLPISRMLAPADKFHSHQFWKEITGETSYEPKSAKASHIQNPVFHYVKRFMAYSLFGRGDSAGVVRLGELFILWHKLNNKTVNVGYFLAQHLSKHVVQPTGDIVVGGLITAIADYLGYTHSIEDLTPVPGSIKLDVEACVTFRIPKPVENGYRLFINVEQSIVLPDPARNDIAGRENWLYERVELDNAHENEPDNAAEHEPQGIPKFQQSEIMVEDAPSSPAGMPSWMESERN